MHQNDAIKKKTPCSLKRKRAFILLSSLGLREIGCVRALDQMDALLDA